MADMKVSVDIKDMDVFKGLAKRAVEFLTDERVNKEVRKEYFQKVTEFLPIDGGIQ